MRRAPGLLGWLIVLELFGAGWYRWPWWRWWRRRVHPWTDVPGGRAAMGTGEAASIVPGVTFVSQRESGAWICCVPTSGTMVAGWAEREPSPHINDAHRIREGAGLPHSGGMTDYDLARGFEAVYGVQGNTIAATKSAVLAALDEGRGLTWFHTYGRLPDNLRRWSPDFTGGHCAAAIGRKSPTSDLVGWFDPLATEGWSGEWVDIDVLLGADWGDPARSFIRKTPPPGGGATVVNVDLSGNLYYGRGYRVPAGVAIYDAPGGTKVGTTAAKEYPYIGSIDEYRCIAVSDRPRYVPFDSGDITEWHPPHAETGTAYPCPPPEPPPPSSGSYDEGYAAGSADMWEQWRTGLGIPEPPGIG